jgi:hypothetical protein
MAILRVLGGLRLISWMLRCGLKVSRLASIQNDAKHWITKGTKKIQKKSKKSKQNQVFFDGDSDDLKPQMM